MNMQIKFKLIFVNKTKKDGTPYTKMMTILKDGENEVWCDIKFGESVNEKQFKGQHQLITADLNDVRFPLDTKPYVSKKDGKTKYPYVWVEKIISSEVLKGEYKSEPKQFTFAVDEEDTPSVSSDEHDLTDEDHPFK